MENLTVERTRTNKPAIWVGGGATSKKFSVRFVLRMGKLPPAIFIRTSGHLSNAYQCLVGLRVGDILVEMNGRRPASPDNPEIFILARRITDFGVDEQGQLFATYEYVDLDPGDIPPSVWRGADTYHNRDGGYFVST